MIGLLWQFRSYFCPDFAPKRDNAHQNFRVFLIISDINILIRSFYGYGKVKKNRFCINQSA
jgi:hypothetical protein